MYHLISMTFRYKQLWTIASKRHLILPEQGCRLFALFAE